MTLSYSESVQFTYLFFSQQNLMNSITRLASSYLPLKISHLGDSGMFLLIRKMGIAPNAPNRNYILQRLLELDIKYRMIENIAANNPPNALNIKKFLD